MRGVKRTAILLGLGAMLVSSLLLVRWRSSQPAEPARAAQAPEPSPAPSEVPAELPAQPAADAPELPGSAEARSAVAATPPPPEPEGLEDGGAPGHPVGDFGWKYAHASADERRAALRSVQRDFEGELSRAVERRVRNGQFQEAACEGLDVGALLQELGAGGKLHLAYLRDPDGNKVCGLYRMPRG